MVRVTITRNGYKILMKDVLLSFFYSIVIDHIISLNLSKSRVKQSKVRCLSMILNNTKISPLVCFKGNQSAPYMLNYLLLG